MKKKRSFQPNSFLLILLILWAMLLVYQALGPGGRS